MTTKFSDSAELNRRHHAALDAAKVVVVVSAISRTMATEDIRDLQIGTHRSRSGWRAHFNGQSIKRALRHGDYARCNMSVARGRRQVVVSQQDLDDPDIRSALEEVGGKAMPQGMNADSLGQARCLGG